MWPNRAIAVSVIFSAVAASPISPSTSARRGEGVRFADAWQHIYFHGHYTFCGRRIPIDLDAILANLALEEGEEKLPQVVDSIPLDPEMLCPTLPDGIFGGLGLQPQAAPLADYGEGSAFRFKVLLVVSATLPAAREPQPP